MFPVETSEVSRRFLECWIAAGRHLSGLGDYPLMAWLKQDPYPPFLAHLSFRYGNQLFFVRVEDSGGEVDAPGNPSGLERIAKACRGFPCRMPMINYAEQQWRPQLPGWGLRHAVTGEPLNPVDLADDQLIEMTAWEVHDLGVQVVRDALKAEGREIMSSQGDPDVDPSIWFIGDYGPEWAVVRTDCFPAERATRPANWNEIVRACSKLSSRGNFASVVAGSEGGGKLYRGRPLSIKYRKLEPDSEQLQAP